MTSLEGAAVDEPGSSDCRWCVRRIRQEEATTGWRANPTGQSQTESKTQDHYDWGHEFIAHHIQEGNDKIAFVYASRWVGVDPMPRTTMATGRKLQSDTKKKPPRRNNQYETT